METDNRGHAEQHWSVHLVANIRFLVGQVRRINTLEIVKNGINKSEHRIRVC